MVRKNMAFIRLVVISAVVLFSSGCAEQKLDGLREKSRQLEAKNLQHLSGIPEPNVVLNKITHENPPVAIARQCQALTTLHGLFDDPLFAPQSLGPLPEGAQKKRAAYAKAIAELEPKYRKASRDARFNGGSWQQVCNARGQVWAYYKLKDREWLALLQQPARELAERQNAWYTEAVPQFKAAKEQAYIQRKWRERITFIVLGALITFLGGCMVTRGWRSMKVLDRYEFENREDGVVVFNTHEDAIKHQRKKFLAYNVLYCGGAVITIIGLIVFFARMFG